MKKVYSFKKEILFKNNIYEILSIAIDKNLAITDGAIKGEFILNGSYLIREAEQDEFNITIPYLNYLEDEYDLTQAMVDIDDFYYEVKDSNYLVINVDISVDGLEERKEERDFIEEVEAKGELIDDDDPDLETYVPIRPQLEESNEYVTYRICIMRDGDTLDSIMEKYNVTMDTLKEYNVLNDLKIGDKLIIPYAQD